MTKCFTEEEVIRLCKAIKENPSLYDPAAPNFGKSLPNKLVWEKISELFIEEKNNGDATKEILKKFNADDVKLKWKNLRDTMALLLRKSNRDPNTWRFYEYVKFLNNYERPHRKKHRKAEKSVFEPTAKIEKIEAKYTLNPSVTVATPISLSHAVQQKFIVGNVLPATNNILSSELNNISIASPLQKLALQRPTAAIVAAKDESPTSTINSLRNVEGSPPLCAEESSREPLTFDDASRDSTSLHHHLTSQAASLVNASPLTIHQHHLQRLQTQSPFISQSREIYDIFGEEVALRLRTIDSSGNKTLFLKTRRDINHILDQAEMEMINQQQPPQH